MIQPFNTGKASLESAKNWKIGSTPEILESINQSNINIAICERDTSDMTNEITDLIGRNIEFRASGDTDEIMTELLEVLDPNRYSHIIKDIKALLHHFAEVVNVPKMRILLATINTNMCRKFHTDINEVRMLCTYSGPGTLWLTDGNINYKSLESIDNIGSIALDENKIQQAQTGAIVLLKGALYPHPETKAVVHRSPTIEESGEKRLLLRIDSNKTANFWM